MKEEKLPGWISKTTLGVVVRVHAQPRASRTEIVGSHGEGDQARLKIRVMAPPAEGRANEELLRFLKIKTGLPASAIQMLRGEASKSKDVLFLGASVSQIWEKLR